MARPKRLKVDNEVGFYHLLSRTVGKEFYFGDVEKEKLLEIIKYYSNYYFVKVTGLCLMSNHFHLLIKSEPENIYTNEEVKQRILKYVDKYKPLYTEGEVSCIDENERIKKYRDKMGNISEYMRDIKQTFSRWYNKTHNRTGYLWGDRFKSILLEKGESLLNCLAYIDLNPIRAKIVKKPEDYRWSSIGYRIFSNNKDNFLSFDGVFSESQLKELNKKQLIQFYRYFVYKCGNIKRLNITELEEGKDPHNIKSSIKDETYAAELKRGFKIPKSDLMLGRIKFFSNGMVIGSKKFLMEAYAKFGGEIIQKKDRKTYKTGINKNILSLRRLNC